MSLRVSKNLPHHFLIGRRPYVFIARISLCFATRESSDDASATVFACSTESDWNRLSSRLVYKSGCVALCCCAVGPLGRRAVGIPREFCLPRFLNTLESISATTQTTTTTNHPRPSSTPLGPAVSSAAASGGGGHYATGAASSNSGVLQSPGSTAPQTPSPWASMSAAALPSTPQGFPHQSAQGLAYNPAAVAAAAYMTTGLPATQLNQGMAFYGAGALPQAQSQSALQSAYPGRSIDFS